MTRLCFLVAAVCVVTVVSGCDLFPGKNDATFVINNNMTADANVPDNYKITAIQFQGPSDSGFGANMLDEGETLNPGKSKKFFLDTQGQPGDWQVKITYNLYVLVVMVPTPDFQNFNDVTAGNTYTWNWTVL